MSPLRQVLGCLAGALLFAALPVRPAAAFPNCTSPPAPDVDWQGCNYSDRQLGKVDLQRANLRDLSYFHGDLTGSDLSEADARRSKFIGSKLAGVKFDRARLNNADLTDTDLTGASFRQTDLRNAHLFRAKLRNADFTGALLDGTDFLLTDLSGATWTDGKTRCAEGSVGQCTPAAK